MKEAKAVGTKRGVASDAGPGAGASAAETPLVAITNMATNIAKKTFIFKASVAQNFSFSSFTLFCVFVDREKASLLVW
ncbi:hypothetical protein SESBI_21205 [Sesbania bispinosa]|nr:hypothetical protein SESBI_21205 [Sesbania bispinosa]